MARPRKKVTENTPATEAKTTKPRKRKTTKTGEPLANIIPVEDNVAEEKTETAATPETIETPAAITEPVAETAVPAADEAAPTPKKTRGRKKKETTAESEEKPVAKKRGRKAKADKTEEAGKIEEKAEEIAAEVVGELLEHAKTIEAETEKAVEVKEEVKAEPAKKKTGRSKKTVVKAETTKNKEETVTEEKTEPAKKKTGRPKKIDAAKKTTAKAEKKPVVNSYIQLKDNEASREILVKRITEQYITGGNKKTDIRTIDMYIKPEENKVYYVINGNENGYIWLF